MRTKTLLLAAALTAAGIASIQAQSNVYSVNVVGYVNVTVPGNAYALIANPLNATNNSLGSVIASPPPATTFYKYTTGSGYEIFTFDEFDLAWTPNGNVSLAPGEGGFIKNPLATPITLTFVGEVLQGSLTNDLPAGYSVRSSKVPQSGLVSTTLGLPANPADVLYKYVPLTGYSIFTFDEFDLAWTPSQPTINVGEAFFSFKGAASSWVRNFTVP
jgi:hypothetical protein